MSYISTIVCGIGMAVFMSAGCSSYEVKVDSDPDAEFERYETFGWLKSSMHLETYKRIDNQQLTDLVHTAVDRIMTDRGYQKLDQGDPDLVFMFYAGVKGPIDVDDQGYSYGKWYDRGESVEQEGVLIIDLIDNERKLLIQRANGGTIVDSPEEAGDMIGKMIGKMLADLPERNF